MTRSTFLPFHQPDLDGNELEAIREVLDSGWLTTGKKTRQFESAFASYVGASEAVAVNSCTAAMHLALEAVGIGPGDFVLTSPYTFAATAEVIRYFDAVPVFVDVEPGTLTLDPERLAERLACLAEEGAPVKAVIPVHIAGHPCDLDAIATLAASYELVVIEDAAHALPTKYHGRLIGGPLGPHTSDIPIKTLSAPTPSITCFSFYATKTLTTGEGGMITTENKDWAERCRMMSMHGISKDSYMRYSETGWWVYQVIAPGFKYNMSDLSAAMGIVQLSKVDRMWKRRVEIASQYTQAFERYQELEPPTVHPAVEHAWHLYILRLNLEALSINREPFIQEMKKRNIGASVHFIPLHLHQYYAETYNYQPQDFPVAYAQYQRTISLPICSPMSDEDVGDVIEVVTALVEENRLKKIFKVNLPENAQLEG